jgi:chemotaxis protein CheD
MRTPAPASTAIARDVHVGMGQIALGRGGDRLKSVLGSCVGVALYYPPSQIAVLSHVVLPQSAGRCATPGKFADTALPAMLAMLSEHAVRPRLLEAKVAGGANMFNNSGPLQIGDANVKAILELLRSAGIRVAGSDLGGTTGRRIVFDCATAGLLVETPGQPSKLL